jgi:uncharacterized membrane protein
MTFPIRVFFLCCVIIAGVIRAVTVKKLATRMLQALPAIIPLALTYFSRSVPE